MSNISGPDEINDEEKARRIMIEVDRLTRLSPNEWKLWYHRSAQTLGIEAETLSDLIEAKLKDIKAAERAAEAEKRRQEERVERQRRSAEREAKHQQEKDQRRIEKDAERKAEDKGKAFADIAKLPSDKQEAELDKLTERLGEDASALRDAFSEYADTIDKTEMPSALLDAVEPWDEAVPTAALLHDIINKIDQHFAARHPHEVLTIALWTMMAWVHDIAATYSAILVATSADIDSGKTTMLGTVSFLTPKPLGFVEATGPSIYRLIDTHKPTLVFDEADDIFKRKPDLAHIINNSWTRGMAKIPRTVKMNGVYVTVFFDVFCPKAIGLLGLNMPRALVSRSIIIKTWPKRAEDKQTFGHIDDDVFAELRRKLARWSADNAAALKDAKPLYPANFRSPRRELAFATRHCRARRWPVVEASARSRRARLPHDKQAKLRFAVAGGDAEDARWPHRDHLGGSGRAATL